MGWHYSAGSARSAKDGMKQIPIWIEWGLIFLSVVLYILSTPVIGMYYMGVVAWVPFLVLFRVTRQKLSTCFVFGCSLAAASFYFILFMGMYQKGLLFNIQMLFLIVVFHGLIFVLLALIFKALEHHIKQSVLRYLLVVLFWGAFEFTCNQFNMGFHLSIGVTQFNNPFILPFIKYVGSYGISMIVLFINCLITDMLISATKAFSNKKFVKHAVKTASILFLITILIAIPQLFSSHYENENPSFYKAVIIQGNIFIQEYNTVAEQPLLGRYIFDKYLMLSEQAAEAEQPDLIIWPEEAINLWLMRLPEYRDRLFEFAEKYNTYLLLGSIDMDEKFEFYNRAFLISPKGYVAGQYEKSILLPFAESFMKKGSKNEPFKIAGSSLGISLCYEILFPDHASERVNEGADALVFLSNNSVFQYTAEHFYMRAAATLRAMENNIPVIIAMNNGVSGVISPQGRMDNKTKLFEEGSLAIEVPIKKTETTFFCLYGRKLYIIMLGILMVGFTMTMIFTYIVKKHKKLI